MDVFLLGTHPEQVRQLTLARESDFRIVEASRGQPVGDAWEPLEVRTVGETPADGVLPLADFHTLADTPTFSQRAVDALHDVLWKTGSCSPCALRTAPATRTT